jgi:predicted Fe-Mo cluster-binding NifX family protein
VDEVVDAGGGGRATNPWRRAVTGRGWSLQKEDVLNEARNDQQSSVLRIAVPTENGRFSPHFGAANRFSLFEVDHGARRVVELASATPPPHEKGAFPRFLAEQGAHVVLAGGMGPRAVQILRNFGIEAVLGVEDGQPEELVRAYLDGTLRANGGMCAGGELHQCNDHGRR